MNITLFTGNIGGVPDGGLQIQTPEGGGKSYVHVSVAVNPPKGSQDPTLWYRCTFWNNLDTLIKYAKKGKPMLCMGRLTKVRERIDQESKLHAELQFTVSQWEFNGEGSLSLLFKEAELVEREVLVREGERRLATTQPAEPGNGHNA
jgi:single-stranded DNA-binding protein